MATFTRTDILEGLQRLGELAQEKGITVQLTLIGGAVMVLAFEARLSTRDVDVADARRLLQELAISNHDHDVLWGRIEPFLVPGDELTAQYAFLDLWESMYGTN
jgi:hypothetical protein